MEPMSTLVPRLWPFLSHSTSSVRRSTLLTLQTLTGNNLKKDEADELNTNNTNTADLTSSSASITITCRTDMRFDSKNLRINFGVIDWHAKLLQEALRHIFQRILVEPLQEIQKLAQEVWMNLIKNANLSALLHAACPFVSSWICLAMQPPKLAFDPAILIRASSTGAHTLNNDTESSRRRKQRIGDDLGGNSSGAAHKLFLGGSEATPIEVRERNYVRARIIASRVLGALSHYLVQPAPGVVYTPDMEGPMDCYTKVLLGHLNSRSAVQKMVCGM